MADDNRYARRSAPARRRSISLFQPYVPEDFDSFWAEAVAEARAVPLNFRRSQRKEFDSPTHFVETLEFTGVAGDTLHGWIAYPVGARRLPSFLWIPPYGRESVLPNQYGTREGFASMSLNFFGESAFHQEKYRIERGYFADGVGEPKTWVFRSMLQNLLIALRVLQAQAEVDETRIATMGLSQGAGMAIWAGALSPIVKAAVADMPFLGYMPATLDRIAHRYPTKELIDYIEDFPIRRQMVMNTISYFDTINFATRCNKPTLLSYGTKDPAVRSESVEAILAALPGEKGMITYDWGHDWHPDMVQNNRQWLLDKLS